MAFIRTEFVEPKVSMFDMDTYHENEWEDHSRINESTWKERYDYEASIICNEINNSEYDIKKVLEIGSGLGVLSQCIQKINDNLDYHLIDKSYAQKYFIENKYKGTFHVKDLSENFETKNLLEKYDFIIMNDFLEHVTNPHLILKTIYKLTHDKSILFISNPNWRMGHPYVYRGLFDFDNFIYLLYFHCFEFCGYYGSILKTPYYPKLDSESLLDDEHITDWNHYMIFKHKQK